MKTESAVRSLAALAQETRLSIFRLLVQAGEAGMAAGEIARNLGVPNATLSFHLKELANAALVRTRQESRFIYYMANFAAMNELLGFLTENCCGGLPCDAKVIACTPNPIDPGLVPLQEVAEGGVSKLIKTGDGKT